MRQLGRWFFPFLFFVFCWWNKVVSQSPAFVDSIISIPTIEIIATTIRQEPVGGTTQKWPSEQLWKLPANNLADLLSTETGVYIKSYGQGSLATSSVRGGGAGHTLVLWNGLPIQNQMLGLLDLALLPVHAVESVGFTRGGDAAMWGSGAIGGVLNLDNQADFSQKINLKGSSQVGSFGHFQQQLKIGLGSEKIQSTTRLSHQQAKNDFYYFLAKGIPERQQTNAQLSQQFLLQDLHWKINSRSRVALHFWRQHSDRQIPPTNVQTRSLAHQDDLTNRTILDFHQITAHGLWQIKTACFDEKINYFDDLILLASRSHFRTYMAEITAQWNWRKRHQFLMGNTNVRTRAWAAGYKGQSPTEHKAALFASWKYKGEILNTQISFRQENVDGNWVPIVPALGVDINVKPNLTIKAKVSRNYRLPTLNDRYWLPGGNPDLLPESGWSQELALVQKMEKGNFEINYSITAFNRNIDNWILWSLRAGESFWSANNITKVWSRGLEPRMDLACHFKEITLRLRGGFDYIRSTNQVALNTPKMDVGDQLIYTPVYQTFGTFSFELKSFHIAYQHSYTGATKGINEPLEAFHVANVRLQYSGSIKNCKGTYFLNLNNIWDADYLVVERRPMPGIHFQTGINLFFHKNH